MAVRRRTQPNQRRPAPGLALGLVLLVSCGGLACADYAPQQSREGLGAASESASNENGPSSVEPVASTSGAGTEGQLVQDPSDAGATPVPQVDITDPELPVLDLGDPTDARTPGEFLDLRRWHLTLPIGDAGDPRVIEPPDLDEFTLDPYFRLNNTGNAVLFRAHAGGVTTGGSDYPRSELRELTQSGDKAAWSTTSGTHLMTITQAILHLPTEKPEVVAGQIHDQSDDVVMIRLEASMLFVEGDGDNLGTLDADYRLGTLFTVKLEAAAGRIRVYYNDMSEPRVDVERSANDCYFKAGVYTQSNTDRGDSSDAYGEVLMTRLSVEHRD